MGHPSLTVNFQACSSSTTEVVAMTTTYYSTSPESVFSDQIKKERKAESSYLHSSSIKGSQSQQKGGMSFIVWVGTGWGSGHLKASRLFWKPTRICVANRLTCSARWRPACKLLCPSSEQVKIWEPQKIKAEMGQCSRFPDIKKRFHPALVTAAPTGPSRG